MCQFNIEGRVASRKANLLGSDIYCDGMTFSYSAKRPNTTAAFAVIWGGSKPLDNPQNVRGERPPGRESIASDNYSHCLLILMRLTGSD